MSKPCGGGIGAWAAEAERAEAEEREAAAALSAAGASVRVETQSFPSLREAATAKPKKKKMTLNEFYSVGSVTGGASGARGSESTRLTPDGMLRLPTGPKERSAEEMQYGRLGGGFSNYGGRSGMPQGRIRDHDDESSWGGGGERRQYGGFDDERRGPPSRGSDIDQPSRADEVDNWAMGKKSLPSFDSGRQSRYGSLGGGSGGGAGDFGGSRVDAVDNWATGKKPVPVRSSTFGSGFRDSGPEPDRWSRGGTREHERDRPRLVLDPPKGDIGTTETVKSTKANPFGAARPRDEIRAEKGLDWKKLELELDTKKVSSSQSSRPTSAHSSRPSSAHSNRSEGIGIMQQGLENVGAKPRPKLNPFGDAKPREVLLQERGKDWKKIDLELEHRAVDRPETEEEKVLKEEIEHLRKELEQQLSVNDNRRSLQGSGGEQPSLQDVLSQRENELEMLIRDLDDKVRYGQKAVERPGSGAGRAVVFPERPPSQSGSFGEARSMEFMDRPRSRGTQEIWTRPGDDRRSFQGGREGGFWVIGTLTGQDQGANGELTAGSVPLRN